MDLGEAHTSAQRPGTHMPTFTTTWLICLRAYASDRHAPSIKRATKDWNPASSPSSQVALFRAADSFLPTHKPAFRCYVTDFSVPFAMSTYEMKSQESVHVVGVDGNGDYGRESRKGVRVSLTETHRLRKPAKSS